MAKIEEVRIDVAIDGVELIEQANRRIEELEAEGAQLEADHVRIIRALNEKYAALERDRDNVERIMREASQRADQNERNLKIVLEREGELKKAHRAKVLRCTERVESLNWLLGSISPATDRRRGIRSDLGEAREGIQALLADLKG